ncbi:ParB/RepB/Spo0J family partition protein [Bacillus spizizenii]|nr:ParB/RepB/Spo0J family partition protein [Bacillus spizizenii]MCY8890466.1 ParB/RepB/Spo0J family partition protein [Bacillus spizizenii]MEC0841921.1 ParB/RepB/Spo0J family partition protein [Bacillus spizizenii]
MSGRNASSKTRSLSKKEQLQKSIFGNNTDESAAATETSTDYAAMFMTPELEKAPSEETAIDIFKLRPAPMEWNFYSPLPDHKMYEMIESIESVGLQNRIIVWQEANKENYIILSGHNRFRAYEMIYNATKDEKYLYIPAKVYKYDEITTTEAKEIVVDTNWVQRSLTPIERAQSIAAKINLINEKKAHVRGMGRTRDLVAERYNIGGRMVDNYKKLLDLEDCFIKMVNDREIKITAGAKLARFNKEIQRWIFEKFYSKINNKTVSKLQKGMTKDEIAEIFNSSSEIEEERTKVNIEIPYGLEKDFTKFFEEWVEKQNLSSKDFKLFIK